MIVTVTRAEFRGRDKDQWSRKAKPRAYFWFNNETILDNLFADNRSSSWRMMKPVIEKILQDHGVKYSKIRWSRLAGCSCGCSPGFIIEGNDGAWDLFVDATIKDNR